MNKLKLHIFLVILFFPIILFSQNQIEENENLLIDTRTLGNHYFTISNFVYSPFILTSIKNSLGAGGVTGLEYPIIEIGEEEYFKIKGDLLVAILGFEYQHAVKDWLAVRIKFNLAGRLGSSFGTFVSQGLNYTTSFHLGWLIKTYRSDKWALSTSVELTNANVAIINIHQFIQDIIDGNRYTSIIKNNNTLRGLVGLKSSYGINRFIGFTGMIDLGYGEAIDRAKKNVWFTRLGLEADMNFKEIIKVPISLSMGYIFSSYPKNQNEVNNSTNVINTQISYLGSDDFVLSLDLTNSRIFPYLNENSVWLSSAFITMRYLF